ncbi:MAG: hypothetical protein FWF57_04245 [Defluviitaleaceae bacterium]|nr:hypothetical protein [Defluviitaleaceae bacterium]
MSDREQLIIKHLYGLFGYEKLLQKNISEVIDVSQATISRTHIKTLKKMRDYVLAKGDIYEALKGYIYS